MRRYEQNEARKVFLRAHTRKYVTDKKMKRNNVMRSIYTFKKITRINFVWDEIYPCCHPISQIKNLPYCRYLHTLFL